MHIHECDVAVIGGGVAGGSAALAFAQQGCSVRLFERRDLARDPNRGDLMHPQDRVPPNAHCAVIAALGVCVTLPRR